MNALDAIPIIYLAVGCGAFLSALYFVRPSEWSQWMALVVAALFWPITLIIGTVAIAAGDL